MMFNIHTPDTAPADSKETLTKLVQNYGFLPNLAGVLAESPSALNGYLAAMSVFDSATTTLPPLERQVVLLSVSVKNRCEYCTAAHSMLANMQGLERTDVEKLHQGLPLSQSRLQALRLFTESIVDTRGRIADELVEDFTNAGFTRAQVLDVILGVAIKTLTNYANHISQPPVNEQFAAFLPNWTH